MEKRLEKQDTSQSLDYSLFPILMVDDEVPTLDMFQIRMTMKGFKVFVASSGEEAIEIMKRENISLLISDQRMPGMSGSHLLEYTRVNFPHIIRMMTTAYADIDAIIDAVNKGEIFRYIKKPWEWADIQLTIQNGVELFYYQRQNIKLINDLRESFLAYVKSMAKALDERDAYTHSHSQRVNEFTRLTSEKLGMPAGEVEDFSLSALLHDIGKIGIPEMILNKKGNLDPGEREIMKTHPDRGASILEPLPGMEHIRNFVRHHHERWDGEGYPRGLKEDQIPMASRIIALSDSLDAMISDRPHRKAMPLEMAIDEIKRNQGKQFDPGIVGIFLDVVTPTLSRDEKK